MAPLSCEKPVAGNSLPELETEEQVTTGTPGQNSSRSEISLFTPTTPVITNNGEREDVDSARSSGSGVNFWDAPAEESSGSGLILSEEYNQVTASNRKVSVRLPPMLLMAEGMAKHKIQGGNCRKLVKGGILQDKVKCILVSAEWFHNLEGKSRLVLTLYDSHGKVKKRLDLFGIPPTRGFSPYRMIGMNEPIVSRAEPGFYYQLECKVNKGHQDCITFAGLICKILPASNPGRCFDYCDPEGLKGNYTGPVNLNGDPEGKGTIDYENGSTFIGEFNEGVWIRGVEYRGTEVKGAMENGNWIIGNISTSLLNEFPYDVHFFKRISKQKKAPLPKDDEGQRDELTEQNGCAAFACFD